MFVLRLFFLFQLAGLRFQGAFVHAAKAVYYIDFLSSEFIPKFLTYPLQNASVLESVSKTDDNPLQSIELPFTFPFMGMNTKIAYVNPNGGVQLNTKYVPACGSTFLGTACTFNTTYYGTIAGYLCDLNPGAYTYSKIVKSYYLNHLTISFKKIHFFGSSYYNNTFHISLGHDGYISIYLEDVVLGSVSGPTLIGLRAFDKNFNQFIQTAAQKSNQIRWSTSISGVYPPRSTLKSKMIYHSCPLSALWCLSPSVVPLGSTSTTIRVSTLSTSCIDLFAFKCSFESLTGSFTSIAQLDPLNNVTFQCTLPPEVTSAIGIWNIHIRGYFTKTLNNIVNNIANSAFATLTRVPLNLTVSYTNISAPPCFAVWPDGSSGDGFRCDTCAICSSQMTGPQTCFNSSCAALYDTPSCDGTCPSTSSAPTNVVDRYGVCCPPVNFDCNGLCFGQSSIQRSVSMRHRVPLCVSSLTCNVVILTLQLFPGHTLM